MAATMGTEEGSNAAGRLRYIVQNTTWMDRQQVGVMHNIYVGPDGDEHTHRYDREQRKKVAVKTHPIIPIYIKYMRGVDMFDQGMNDYNVSLRSIRWYLRVFFYYVNAALGNMRIITRQVVEQSDAQRKEARRQAGIDAPAPKRDPWYKYFSSTLGGFHWMADMGHALIERACEMEGYDGSDESKRPSWMRQKNFVPCCCNKKCFFCKNHLTGKYGPPRAPAPKRTRPTSNTRTPASTPRGLSRTSSSTSSTTRSTRSSGSRSRSSTNPTIAVSRGRPYEVVCDHVTNPICIFNNSRNCGVCMEEGRRRKPNGVVRNEENKHLYVNKATLGCPHLDCKDHPICSEHWPTYRHKKINY